MQNNPRENISNDYIKKLIYIVYWLLIFEGVLRKWLLPELHQIIFFIRDPFVILIYLAAVRYGRTPKNIGLYYVTLFLCLLTVILSIFQAGLSSQIDFWVLGVGLRNYILYLPLPFFIWINFSRDDVINLVKQSFYVLIICTPLVVLQSSSPPDSPINRGSSESIKFTPLGGGVLRTQGLFTSILGQTNFVASVFSMLLSCYLDKRLYKKFSPLLIYSTTVCLAISVLVSGSRYLFVYVGVIFISVLIVQFLAGSSLNAVKLGILGIILLTFGYFLATTYFQDATTALLERSQGAAYRSGNNQIGGDLVERILDDFNRIFYIFELVPLQGYGIGYASNAFSGTLGTFINIENDLSRNLFELGPIMGFIYIIFRYVLAIYIMFLGVSQVKKNNSYLTVCLASFTAVNLIIGTVTGHGSVHGFTWIFLGLTLATTISYGSDDHDFEEDLPTSNKSPSSGIKYSMNRNY